MLEFRTVEAEQQSRPEIAYKVHTLALPTCKSGIIKVDVGSSDVLQYLLYILFLVRILGSGSSDSRGV